MKRVHVFISGYVQGIGFRSWVRVQARNLGLTGWVKNLADGQVEVVAEGEESKLLRLVKSLKEGPPLAQVEKIEMAWLEPSFEFSDFEIK